MSVSSKGFISISSKDRSNFPSTGPKGVSNARYEEFGLDVENVNGFGVSEVFFDDGNTNITLLNNRIYWDDGSQSFEASIAPAQYDYANMATALQSAMVAVQAGITVTQSNGIFTITFPNPTSFILPLTPTGERFYTGKLISEMLNMDFRDTSLLIHTSISPAKLYYSCYVDFVSHRMNYGRKISDTDSNKKVSDILCRVYFDDPENTRKTIKEFKNIKWIYSDLTNNQTIDIELFDEFGNRYDEVDMMYNLLFMTT